MVLIGVHTPKSWDKVPAYVESAGIDYPVCLDATDATKKAYGINSYPDYCLIDRNGVLRFADLANGELDRAVEYLLKEPGPEPDFTRAIRALVEAQPRVRIEALQGEKVLVTVDLQYSLVNTDGEMRVRCAATREGLTAWTEVADAAVRNLALRSVAGHTSAGSARTVGGADEEERYSYKVDEQRLASTLDGETVDLELPTGTVLKSMLTLRGALLPFEEGARAVFHMLDADTLELQSGVMVSYVGQESVELGGREVQVHVVEMTEDGESQGRLLLDGDHLLVGMQMAGKGTRIRVSTPADER